MTSPISFRFQTTAHSSSSAIGQALRYLEDKARNLPLDAFDDVKKIQDYVCSLESLVPVNSIEYADFLRYQINSGRRITNVSPLNYDEVVYILKTTQAITQIPDNRFYGRLHLMVMPGHTLFRENPQDGIRIYDWSGNAPAPDLILPRDIATIMLARLWKPQPDHFGENCRSSEVDKLLQRGRKSPKVYAGMEFAIQPPK